MKMYERLIPEPVTLAEQELYKFCEARGIDIDRMKSETREEPYPTLRKKFAKQVQKEQVVTHQEIADAICRKRVTVTKYLNGLSEINYRR